MNAKQSGIFWVAGWAWTFGVLAACGRDQVPRDDQGGYSGERGVEQTDSSGGAGGSLTSGGGGGATSGASGGMPSEEDMSSGGASADGGTGSGGTPSGGASGGESAAGAGGSEPVSTCGDGAHEGEEACDDGNTEEDDGCSTACLIEDGWTCPEPNAPCVDCRSGESPENCPGWYCPVEGTSCIDCGRGPALGCPCVDSDYPSGAYALGDVGCNGPAQKVSLRCDVSSAHWVVEGTCPAGKNCEQVSGVCRDVTTECLGKRGGDGYCTPGDVLEVCDADLVNVSSVICEGVCSDETCQAPRCGDRKIQSNEECDDGNDTHSDGCEPASSSAPCQESQVIQLAAGSDFSCALLTGGKVRCWGDNEYGQLGIGNLDSHKTDEPWEIPLVQLSADAESLAASARNACAVLSNGNVQCWGYNADGQLGQGSLTPDRSATPLTINFSSNVAEVAVGGGHVCARLATGAVQCWGRNSSGHLGNLAAPTVSSTTAAHRLAGVNLGGVPAIGLALTGNSSCAVVQGGAVYCWGSNSSGVLGLGLATSARIGDDETPASAGPLAFRGAKAIAQIEGGASHLCARSTDGYLQCWGRNADAQLGTLNHSNVGDNVLSLASGAYAQVAATVLNVSVGSSSSCAFLTGNELKCWGSNDDGQLGMALSEAEWGGSFSKSPDLAPNLLSGSITAADLGHGTAHVCALSEDNSVRCWGRNEDGQLGRGDITPVTALPSTLASVDIFFDTLE